MKPIGVKIREAEQEAKRLFLWAKTAEEIALAGPHRLINLGQRVGDDEDGGWTVWALFECCKEPTDEDIEDAIFQTCWTEYYSGPGLPFAFAPWAKVSNRRILVRQSGGYDI